MRSVAVWLVGCWLLGWLVADWLAAWLLVGWLLGCWLAGCLVTGLSFDGSADSRNPMRSIVFGCLVGVVAVVNGSILGCWLQVADDLVTFWLPDY